MQRINEKAYKRHTMVANIDFELVHTNTNLHDDNFITALWLLSTVAVFKYCTLVSSIPLQWIGASENEFNIYI